MWSVVRESINSRTRSKTNKINKEKLSTLIKVQLSELKNIISQIQNSDLTSTFDELQNSLNVLLKTQSDD